MENGYQSLRPGQIASVVTYLEMRHPPELTARQLPAGFEMRRMERLAIADYRAAFRAIGENWLWFSRLVMPDADLTARLANPAMEVHFLLNAGRPVGILELDLSQPPDIEIVLFGIEHGLRGQGLGAAMMRYALQTVWERNPARLWLHTCTLDDPRALGFYIHSGFMPYKRAVEVANDPRLQGILPKTAAPQVPLL